MPERLLKRHLRAAHGPPEQYRAKWGLPANYPLAAPNTRKFVPGWRRKPVWVALGGFHRSGSRNSTKPMI
jgi:hypothetical protein